MALVSDLPGHVSAATDDDHVDGVAAQMVARPESAAQTADLLRACHQRELAVVVRGHGTKLTWGRPPERVDLLLDTTAMNGLVEHARGDLIATVGAGMPLARLQGLLADAGHQVALDDVLAPRPRVGTVSGTGAPDIAAGSTVGGAMMTNVSGPRRMWVGTLRDLVIGVKFVRADGTAAKAGGKVVKNVAGYDLSKLFTGSFGTLAVITEVTLRLHPLPAASHWVGLTLAADRLGEVLATMIASQLVPNAVEVHAAPGLDPTVVALIEGTEAGALARAEQLADQLGADAWVHQEAPTWWATMPSPAEHAQGSSGALLKTTARLSGIPELVAELTSHGATVIGSAGTGVLYAALPVDAGSADASSLASALASIRRTSSALGGSTIVLDAPAALKPGLDTWGPIAALDLMRRVKAEFDPQRVLAPGRFVGGL
ncbi:MAG: FAD-binding oxidoreductase [Ornithinimicrobium sp.]|uniref:FAD-binding oxidoreductase n=1 Tax=Ornithinimicrobium sp. TaxID=1977084 RepID=UPI0026E03664|nr:FAD-binding oxidoreductase [Ornithinimicrobium sp.]MDO5739751.1 FAD-binding oxidoreductase [Ornithinimicrobium sp.]